MRIAIDARKISDFGIGTYLRGLVPALAAARPDWSLVLIGESATDGPQGDRIHWLPDRTAKYGLVEPWAMARRARETGADLFHAPHYVFPVRLTCPGIVTIHDCIHLRYPEQLPRPFGVLPRRLSRIYALRMMRHAGRAAGRVIAVSETTARDLEALVGIDPGRIHVIHNGCDAAYLRDPRPDELAAADELMEARGAARVPFVLFAGNPKPHKNLPRLLAALARISGDDVPSLVLAGVEEVLAERLRRQAAPRLSAGRVHALGKVGAVALRGLFARARLLAVPSLFEGFGLTALEAMAAGVPVVAGNAGALPEVVADAAVQVDPGDTAAIAGAIGRLWGDADLRAELSRRGRARSLAFTWEAAARRTVATYLVALEEAR